ncbi:ATP-binding protein [Herbaspirillum sp. ST 5-3]|uniref:AAA family ATPase n=1 Tax=Oxalobacteraceae TaxID=75682 RepID=UPI0010A3D563|nr:ATP-binding protein [Herbaspirillum sp. ST 5-3]
MRILKFEVTGLLNRDNNISVSLSDDLNILTGRNGAGKTSVLKLLWYIVSGNIILALREVPFKKAALTTDRYLCIIHRTGPSTCKIELSLASGQAYLFEDEYDQGDDSMINAEDQANPLLIENGSSVFFPTFRRIEGGFSLDSQRSGNALARAVRAKSDVEEALLVLSRRLTNEPHVFVSSISTVDIVTLLLRQHSDLSEIYNALQQNTSQSIIQTIKEYKRSGEDADKIDSAHNVLDNIRDRIESMEGERERIMQPIEAVRELVERLFKHTGIKIGNRLSFGDAANAVNSDALSAGEKQMLSFICYNAFYKNSVIFIDEPELSLHVDWQRQLFPILQKQQSSNQFIIATHSPFIYSKYPDKEVSLDSDRGDTEE